MFLSHNKKFLRQNVLDLQSISRRQDWSPYLSLSMDHRNLAFRSLTYIYERHSQFLFILPFKNKNYHYLKMFFKLYLQCGLVLLMLTFVGSMVIYIIQVSKNLLLNELKRTLQAHILVCFLENRRTWIKNSDEKKEFWKLISITIRSYFYGLFKFIWK